MVGTASGEFDPGMSATVWTEAGEMVFFTPS